MKIYKWYKLECVCGSTNNLNHVISKTRDIKIMCKQCILKEIQRNTKKYKEIQRNIYCNNCLKITSHIPVVLTVENGLGLDYIVDNNNMVCCMCNIKSDYIILE